MKLNSERMLRSIEFFVFYAGIYKATPCKWDRKTSQIFTTRLSIKLWTCTMGILLVNQVFMSMGLIWSLYLSNEKRNLTYYTLQVLYFIGCLIASMAHICYYLRTSELVLFINQCMTYFGKFQGKKINQCM